MKEEPYPLLHTGWLLLLLVLLTRITTIKLYAIFTRWENRLSPGKEVSHGSIDSPTISTTGIEGRGEKKKKKSLLTRTCWMLAASSNHPNQLVTRFPSHMIRLPNPHRPFYPTLLALAIFPVPGSIFHFISARFLLNPQLVIGTLTQLQLHYSPTLSTQAGQRDLQSN